jgi:hypothetical protein
VNGYRLHLSPTQYRICRAFLSSSEIKDGLVVGKFVILSYQSFDELLDETDLPRSSLIKHISNLNARISTSRLELCSFQGGYILTFSAIPAQKVRQCQQ